MTYELHGSAKVIGKNEEQSLLRTRYTIAYETSIDGQNVTGTRNVAFDEYCKLRVGDSIKVILFSGDGRKITSSRVDAGLESLFGSFIHPSLKE